MKSAGLDTKAKYFGKFMAQVWNITGAGIDTMVSETMSGKAMDGPYPLLLSLLEGGGWVDAKILNRDALSMTSLQRYVASGGRTTLYYSSILW